MVLLALTLKAAKLNQFSHFAVYDNLVRFFTSRCRDL